MSYEEALEKWKAQRETKYKDGEIKGTIAYALGSQSAEFSAANAQCALAMIAYNEMIDTRIERAERSWRAYRKLNC